MNSHHRRVYRRRLIRAKYEYLKSQVDPKDWPKDDCMNRFFLEYHSLIPIEEISLEQAKELYPSG